MCTALRGLTCDLLPHRSKRFPLKIEHPPPAPGYAEKCPMCGRRVREVTCFERPWPHIGGVKNSKTEDELTHYVCASYPLTQVLAWEELLNAFGGGASPY
jgi:hypothetical protein